MQIVSICYLLHFKYTFNESLITKHEFKACAQFDTPKTDYWVVIRVILWGKHRFRKYRIWLPTRMAPNDLCICTGPGETRNQRSIANDLRWILNEISWSMISFGKHWSRSSYKAETTGWRIAKWIRLKHGLSSFWYRSRRKKVHIVSVQLICIWSFSIKERDWRINKKIATSGFSKCI